VVAGEFSEITNKTTCVSNLRSTSENTSREDSQPGRLDKTSFQTQNVKYKNTKM
jgi:hypothetical protein